MEAESTEGAAHHEADGEHSTDGNLELTMNKAQKARAERNRLKALALKKARLLAQPYTAGQERDGKLASRQPQNGKKLVDSGGGFFLEDNEDEEQQQGASQLADRPPPMLGADRPDCASCKIPFGDSYLFRMFELAVCDNCRDMSKDGDHELMARTEAKTAFLLKDHDFEEGPHGPALRYICRRNPHNPGGGQMRLYLRLQVEERAIKVWGSEEALQEELEAREEKKVVAKSKKYAKKMKELRMAVRSSLYSKDLSAHVHKYGEEEYHEERDEYSQTCTTCGHVNTYEKM